MTTSPLTASPLTDAGRITSRRAVLVLATSTSSVRHRVSRWADETTEEVRARAIAADCVEALGFPEVTFHQLSLELPVLAAAASAAMYVRSINRRTNCGHLADRDSVVTIRMCTLDDETHYAYETCEEGGCPADRCEGRAHIDCEACVRDPLIEPNLKRCEWCRRDGVQGEALAAIAMDGVVVLTSQCAACVTHARGARLPTRL
ncbi:hypothetical protein GCM10023339_76320 [Alloalcanivorax gelatiniphagus]